ncbi:hypothetical protein ACIA5C_37375 [Actinoplanes sp. NPDC051343]|uniref:hypothetical protein n=1 Tax=Actinoplanes sp. NPDC051343 TaxID=3363906 RepID=UPI003792AC2E
MAEAELQRMGGLTGWVASVIESLGEPGVGLLVASTSTCTPRVRLADAGIAGKFPDRRVGGAVEGGGDGLAGRAAWFRSAGRPCAELYMDGPCSCGHPFRSLNGCRDRQWLRS